MAAAASPKAKVATATSVPLQRRSASRSSALAITPTLPNAPIRTHGSVAHRRETTPSALGRAASPALSIAKGNSVIATRRFAFDFAIGQSARDTMCLRSFVGVGTWPELHQHFPRDEPALSRRLRG